jgi:hypothetical protein
MLPFMGVVDNSTTSPFFINCFLSLGYEGVLLSSSREFGVILYNDPPL